MSCAVETCDKPESRRGWCSGHYERWKQHGDVRADVPLRARFDRHKQLMSKIRRDDKTGHWFWTGHVNAVTGYGMVKIDGTPNGAHRAVYELLVGPISNGFVPDHVCEVKHCVNVLDPDHIELVTHAVNTQRWFAAHIRQMCGNDLHEMTEANTYRRPDGGRTCRACKNANAREAYRHQKEISA